MERSLHQRSLRSLAVINELGDLEEEEAEEKKEGTGPNDLATYLALQ